MKTLICAFFCLICTNFVHGYVIEVAEIEYDSAESNSIEDYTLEARQCKCFKQSGCLCTGEKSGFQGKVKVFVSLDELERNGKEHILAHFCVNGAHFVKKFPANKRRFFCHEVKGKRYCFVFKVHDDGKENTLPGCIRMVKPVNIDLGCFRLPL